VLTLADGTQERVEVAVKRVPTAVLALGLKSRPLGLTIAIDGTPADVADAEKPREVDVGEHVVAVEAPGYAPFYWKQTLADGDTQRITVALTPRRFDTPKWLFYTVAGVAVAAEGVATGLAVSAQSSQNAELAKDALHRSASTQSSIQSKATVANVLFISGGVIGLGALALAFTTHWKADASADAPTVSFSPVVAPGSAGLGVHGCF
jgi:Na+(H+)/acetate symporter ActP